MCVCKEGNTWRSLGWWRQHFIGLYKRDVEMVYNMTRDHFYGCWDDEEGSENVIIDASINIKVNHIENEREIFDEILGHKILIFFSRKFFY